MDLSDDDTDEDPAAQSISSRPAEPSSQKATTNKAKKRKMPDVIDVSTSLREMNSNIATFMGAMNTHLSTMAQAMVDVSKHEVAIMNKEELLDKQKMGLNEVISRIPGLTFMESLMGAEKLASNPSNLTLFYNSPSEEWRKQFILHLVRPHT